jgi:hypothetical protein
VLDAALAALVTDDALLGLSPGKINRSSRHQQAIAALEDRRVVRDDVEYGDLKESHPDSSTRLAAMFRHVAYGDFEDVFVAAWMVPEARQRGAALSDEGLGRRLTELIDVLADATEDEAGSRGRRMSAVDSNIGTGLDLGRSDIAGRGQAELDAPDSRDDVAEGN